MVSSGDAYASEEIPKVENKTGLEPCSQSQAQDETESTYGNRKAECDREIFRAAKSGVNAMSVRPCIIYGPWDYTQRLDYWIHRVNTYDAVVIPGDGQNIWHRAFVKDVANALRIVAEKGKPGEAYNVGDQTLLTLKETVELIADILSTEIDCICASPRELKQVGLTDQDFILYRKYPHILDTNKLANLGWSSTPHVQSYTETIEESVNSNRDGSAHCPGRDLEEQLIGILSDT